MPGRAAIFLMTIAVTAASTASAEAPRCNPPPDFAAKLQQLFPGGFRNGYEGVRTQGGCYTEEEFQRGTPRDCQARCWSKPAGTPGGCVAWSWITSSGGRGPARLCVMWSTIPELRPNPSAFSGEGKIR